MSTYANRDSAKILVTGNAGSGKTTFATLITDQLNIPSVGLEKAWTLNHVGVSNTSPIQMRSDQANHTAYKPSASREVS